MNTTALFWIIAAVVFGIAEMSTVQLVSIWFCIAAVCSSAAAYFTDSFWLSVYIFVGVSAVLLIATRPIVRHRLKPKAVPTNADRIIGEEAVVTESINPMENSGQIKVKGQIWSAKSSMQISKGEVVRIHSIEGVKAVVERVI